MEVTTGVHLLTRGIVNWYLIEDGGKVTLVDAGAPTDWPVLLHALADLGRQLADVDSVLVTHAHSDHTGFAERARSEGGATVRIHEADAAAAQGGTPAKTEAGPAKYLARVEAYRTLFGLLRRGAMKIIPIANVSTFADGETMDVPGRPRVVHVPGHTPGSCALWFQEHSVLCTGDALVTRNPFTGRVGPQVMPRLTNQDSALALASLARFDETGTQTLLPGHGAPWRGNMNDAVLRARAAGPS